MNKNLLKDNLIARWLDNRLQKDEKEKLEKSGELDELKIVLDDIDTWKVKEFDVDTGLADLNRRKKLVITPAPPKDNNIKRWLNIAASILLFATTSYFSWNYFSNQNTVIKTGIAESKTIELPIGSSIKLDALSSITYKEKDWKNNRTIHLTGQAFFDVTKGNSFKVITKVGTIHVLGTQFNVNVTNQKFEVICYEGKVNVIYNTDEEILTKGQSVQAKENNLISNIHTTNVPEWVNGFSKYNKAILLDIVTDLQKYYNTKIELPQQYQNLQFTGTITHKNLNTALQTLFTSMEIKYSIDDNNTVIIEQ